MSVRKRSWTTGKGEAREGWIVAYTGADGARHIKTFARKKDADAEDARIKVDVGIGVHVAPSRSITVKAAGASWIAAAEANGLERSTVNQYREHVRLHIDPYIGSVKLTDLSAQMIRKLEDRLREEGRSTAMIRRVIGSLGSLLADAQERGFAARNPVRDLRRNRRRGKDLNADRRRKGKLKVGVDIPTPDEVKAILAGAPSRWRPLLVTAVFTGLRASELRGVRWADVDLDVGQLHVRQRADRFNEIGKPKSAAGERTLPLPKMVANTLREWKLACPKSGLDLVFPNGAGRVESLSNIRNRGLVPAGMAGGVTLPLVGADGKPRRDAKGNAMVKAKYPGMHALRHFFASWCINRPEDGGLGLPPKMVQERLGHSSIAMTFDRYGHLFPRSDDAKALDLATRSLIA